MPDCNDRIRTTLFSRCRYPFSLYLALALLLGLAVRLTAVYLEPCISSDGVIYVKTVQDWLKTGKYVENLSYLPLLPFLMKLLARAGMDIHAAGVAVSIASGLFVIAAAGWIVRFCTHSREYGIAAAILAAVHPELVDLSINIQRDSIYLAFAGFAILFFLKYFLRGGTGNLVLAAVLTALGIFCRYEMLEFLPAFMLIQCCRMIRKSLPAGKLLADTGIFAFCFLVFVTAAGWIMGIFPTFIKMYSNRLEMVLQGVL